MTETISLSELTGRHVLNTAAVQTRIKDTRYTWSTDDLDAMSIGIDGKTYTFVEDGNDGYRSYMGDIQVEDGLNSAKLIGASLINREVWINHITVGNAGLYDWDSDYKSDLIQIIDLTTAHVWAILGTTDVDDYYPSCIMDWRPMNPEDYKDAVPMREMKEIPIKAAQAVAESFGYDQVVIFARRVGNSPHPFGEHMTTYGTTTAHCAVAAKMGDVLKSFMKWDV